MLVSLEYASRVAGARLVVVLGHTSCGAIKGACDNVKLGNLTPLLGRLREVANRVDHPVFDTPFRACCVRPTFAIVPNESKPR